MNPNYLLDDIIVAPFDTHAAKAYDPIRAGHEGHNSDASRAVLVNRSKTFMSITENQNVNALSHL